LIILGIDPGIATTGYGVIQKDGQKLTALDYGVIAPRLQVLYEWSARELGLPRLLGLIRDGTPIYAWSYADRQVWRQTRDSLPLRALRVATSGREEQ